MTPNELKPILLGRMGEAITAEEAKQWAECYATIVNAQTQELMTNYTIRPCDCEECKRDNDFDEVIN